MAALVLVVSFAASASAQVFTGRVDVTVEDATGGRLPGVTVDLTGPSMQTQVTDAQGQAHFLNLPVGMYAIKATLSGFGAYNNPQVQVATGAATPLSVRMTVAGQVETVNVTAATPIVDTKRETTTTNITLEELQNIPTARDPWVVMQTVPTIYVDRVNVGGSESGQQSNYIGKGSGTGDNTWSIDGVPITDMGSTGSTPTYYDFDMFQEMSVTTGGADAQNPTPGVQLNLVLKKGGNTPHGNARYYFENESLQGNNMTSDQAKAINSATPLSAACVASGFTEHCGNRTDYYKDYGFDLGGPLLKDRLWAWGSIGETHPRILTLNGAPDETILRNYALKADGQVNASTRANFTFFEGNKEKFGRGASATHPAETTYDQTGPTKYFKGEGNFTLGQNLFAAARYAHISGGFSLTPEGGLDKSIYQDAGGVWHNSFYYYTTTRPQDYIAADASYFKGKHEIKFGFSWRKTPVDSLSTATGNKVVSFWGDTNGNPYPAMTAYAEQDYALHTDARYQSGFITDTISLDRLTVIAGLRLDHQTSSYSATTVDAVPGFPLLPAVSAPAVDNVFVFTNVTPRVGITYALDDNRKTVGRASYAMFASQLPGTAGAFVAPIQPYTYVIYNAVDKNGNGYADANEIDFASGVQGANNVDLAHPGVVTTNNKVGSISAPRTQEMLFGVDHEVMPNLGVSATVTYRYMNNFLWNPPNGVTSASYHQTGTFTVPASASAITGVTSVPVYGATGVQLGYTAQNRPDYHQKYLGLELSATKRMANKWMGRVGFATTSWNEYFDAPDAILDPTRTLQASGQYSNTQVSGPHDNGGPVAVQSTGSGKSGIFLLPPKYQFSANGLYQGPWGLNFGGNWVLRQGYAEPYYRDRVNTNDQVVPTKSILLTTAIDQFRLDAVSMFDARVEKQFKFGTTNLALDFDVFNLFNANTVLQYQVNARVSTFNSIQEITQPRIIRLGARFFF
jgi:hypothetical protein